jgi:hypothetical protein
MINTIIAAITGAIAVPLAIPPLARAILNRKRKNAHGREFYAREMIQTSDAIDEADDNDGDDLDDELVAMRDIWDDTASEPVETRPQSWRVAPGRATRFQRKMAYWLKAEFPGAIRSRTVADDEVMRLALSKYLRAKGVRNKDIVLHTPRILTLAYLPTRADAIEAQVRMTYAVADRLADTQVRRASRTLLEWLAGVEKKPGLTLAAK